MVDARGGTWISLAELGMEYPEPTVPGELGCYMNFTALESTTFFFGGHCLPNRDGPKYLWILSQEASN